MGAETQEKVIDLTRLAEEWPGFKSRLDAIPTKDELTAIFDKVRPVKEEIVDPKKTVALKDDVELDESGIAGMFKSVTNIKVVGIPLGSVAAGSFIAVFTTELVDGFMSKQTVQTKGFVKLAGAAGFALYGKKIIGNDLSGVVAVLLTFDALRDLTPIDAWAASAASKISGMLPSAGLADRSNRRGDVHDQANKVVKDYYSRAFGR